MRQKVVFLMGPTASGKTKLALELAKRRPIEVVSVDSAMVYRGLNIGTAKPVSEELAEVPHHLINVRDPAEAYSVAEFRNDALNLIQQIIARKNIPFLVGGTMLYFKSLISGIDTLPHADASVREQITAIAQAEGWQALHERLQVIDPESAARIHKNDRQRLQRALEVYDITGQPLSSLQGMGGNSLDGGLSFPYDVKAFALAPPSRADLWYQIEVRFRSMLEKGLVDEVAGLKARTNLNINLPSMRSVGYRQVWEYLDGLYDYNEMLERAVIATRQLAKRQMTWLRGWERKALTSLVWLESVEAYLLENIETIDGVI